MVVVVVVEEEGEEEEVPKQPALQAHAKTRGI